MKRAPDLKVRTREFAVRIIRLCSRLPKTPEANVIRGQLLRSGTSVGAIYREGTRSRSKAEYAAKLNLALMELEESLYWFELLEHAGITTREQLEWFVDETSQLMAILVALIKKSKAAGR